MVDFLKIIVAPMTLPEDKFGVVIVNSKLKETLPVAVKSTLEEALKAGMALSRFFDCEIVEAPPDAYKIGIVSWDPEKIGSGNGQKRLYAPQHDQGSLQTL